MNFRPVILTASHVYSTTALSGAPRPGWPPLR
jgi:hypothetical protein